MELCSPAVSQDKPKKDLTTHIQALKTGIERTYSSATTKLNRVRPEQLSQVPNWITASTPFLRRAWIEVKELGIPAKNGLAAWMPIFC